MTIGFSNDSDADLHGRYVLIYPDAPTLVTMELAIDNQLDDNEAAPVSIIALSADGGSEQVTLTREDDGVWYMKTLDGAVVEEISYVDGSEEVAHHDVFVNGFATDEVPVFMVGVTNR